MSVATPKNAVAQPATVVLGMSGCPYCSKSEPLAAPTDSTPAPAPDECPCGGVELVAIPAERPSDVVVPLALAVERTEFAAFTAPVISQVVASVPGLRELPNLTVEDILYKHHVLRC